MSTSQNIVEIDGNTIQDLTSIGVGADIHSNYAAIVATSDFGVSYRSNDIIIRNNVIGRAGFPQSLRAAGTATTNSAAMNGILFNFSANPTRGEIIVENNIIRNLSHEFPLSTGTGTRVHGIESNRGYLRIRDNLIENLHSDSLNNVIGYFVAVAGIQAANYVPVPAPNDRSWGSVISGNTIRALGHDPASAPASRSMTYGILAAFPLTTAGVAEHNRLEGNVIHDFEITTPSGAVLQGILVLSQDGGGSSVISNNLISLGSGVTAGDVEISCIVDTGYVPNNHYHNTVIVAGNSVGAGTAVTHGFLFTAIPPVTPTECFNNIMANLRNNGAGTGTHYSIRIADTITNWSGDHNLYFGTGPDYSLGYFTADHPTLADWQAAFPGMSDVNSLFGDPLLASIEPPDPDVACASPAIQAALPIATVTTDIFGDPRGVFLVDIGARESMDGPPQAQPAALAAEAVSEDSIEITFTHSVPASDGYIILRNTGSPVSGLPVNGITYLVDDLIGTATVVFVGDIPGTFTDSGLAISATFHYAAFSYRDSMLCGITYLTTDPSQDMATTGVLGLRDWMLLD